MAFFYIKKLKQQKIVNDLSPRSKLLKRFFDRMVYFAAFLAVIMTLPQVFIIWTKKTAEGVSLITWISYLIVSIIFLFYGLFHREKPLIFMYGSYIFLDILIIYGVVRFN